tara:strand:- start:1139 stop:1390 length:252 start_codon:yes stop_codon:yes gene_type:complete
MNVVAYIWSFCERTEGKELIEDNICILKQIYNETKDFAEESEESDSEDDDYEPPEDVSDTDTSEGDREEIIIKKDSKGHYYIY